MKNLNRKQITATAVQHTGNVLELRKFVGISNADYDGENKAFIIPQGLVKPGARQVVYEGEFLLKEGDHFSAVSEGELNDVYEDADGKLEE